MFAWIEVGGIEVGWVLVLVLLSGQNTERQIGASSECWTRSVSAKAEAAHGRGDAHVSEREQTTGGRAAIYDLPYATWENPMARLRRVNNAKNEESGRCCPQQKASATPKTEGRCRTCGVVEEERKETHTHKWIPAAALQVEAAYSHTSSAGRLTLTHHLPADADRTLAHRTPSWPQGPSHVGLGARCLESKFRHLDGSIKACF